MKKLLIVTLTLSTVLLGQCLSTPISTRVGIKFGFNPGTYDPGDGSASFSGSGMHFGFGMGADFMNLIAFDIIPQYRSTSYGRDEPLGRHTYTYKNIYFPIILGLKGGMIPLISPYLDFGIGFNIQVQGVDRFEFNNGTAIENNLEGSNTSGYLIIGFGLEIKLTKFRLSPEFTAHLQPNEETSAQTNDYHISIGAYYSP